MLMSDRLLATKQKQHFVSKEEYASFCSPWSAECIASC